MKIKAENIVLVLTEVKEKLVEVCNSNILDHYERKQEVAKALGSVMALITILEREENGNNEE